MDAVRRAVRQRRPNGRCGHAGLLNVAWLDRRRTCLRCAGVVPDSYTSNLSHLSPCCLPQSLCPNASGRFLLPRHRLTHLACATRAACLAVYTHPRTHRAAYTPPRGHVAHSMVVPVPFYLPPADSATAIPLCLPHFILLLGPFSSDFCTTIQVDIPVLWFDCA